MAFIRREQTMEKEVGKVLMGRKILMKPINSQSLKITGLQVPKEIESLAMTPMTSRVIKVRLDIRNQAAVKVVPRMMEDQRSMITTTM
jgi:hypothetical protein